RHLQSEPVAVRPAGERTRDVAATGTEIEQPERPRRIEQGADAVAVEPAPARDRAVDGPEQPVGALEASQVALGVVHELEQPRLALPQAAHPASTRIRAASRVSPGPNAIAHTVPRAPAASSSRSTNSTVGLDMLP